MPDIALVAPDLTLPRANGVPVTLPHPRGDTAAPLLYRHDDTSCRTWESIGFSKAPQEFASPAAPGLGISADRFSGRGELACEPTPPTLGLQRDGTGRDRVAGHVGADGS